MVRHLVQANWFNWVSARQIHQSSIPSLRIIMSPSLRRVMSPSLRGVISSIFLTEGQERGLVSRITLIPLLMLVLKRPKIFAWKKFAFALLLSFSPSGRSYNCPSDFLPDQAILRNLSSLCVSKGKTKTKIRVAWVGMAKSLRCTSPPIQKSWRIFPSHELGSPICHAKCSNFCM